MPLETRLVVVVAADEEAADPFDRDGVPGTECTVVAVELTLKSSRLHTEPGPVVPLNDPVRDETDLGGGTSVRGTARFTSTYRNV